MSTEIMYQDGPMPNNVGVINPFALTELVTGKEFSWGQVTEPRDILEEFLETRYDLLFDPQYDSPLYAGMKLSETMEIERIIEESPSANVGSENDSDPFASDPDVSAIKKLEDLRNLLGNSKRVFRKYNSLRAIKKTASPTKTGRQELNSGLHAAKAHIFLNFWLHAVTWSKREI